MDLGKRGFKPCANSLCSKEYFMVITRLTQSEIGECIDVLMQFDYIEATEERVVANS